MTRGGKRIKQGLIYRGQELVTDDYVDHAGANHVKTVNDTSINILINELGIKKEIDFEVPLNY